VYCSKVRYYICVLLQDEFNKWCQYTEKNAVYMEELFLNNPEISYKFTVGYNNYTVDFTSEWVSEMGVSVKWVSEIRVSEMWMS
jgi:hypothetical protein